MASRVNKRASTTGRSNNKRSHAQSQGAPVDYTVSAGEGSGGRALEGLMGLRGSEGSVRKSRKAGASEPPAPSPVDVSAVHNALMFGAPAVATGGSESSSLHGDDEGLSAMPTQLHGGQQYQMVSQADLVAMQQQMLNPHASVPVPVSTLAFLTQGMESQCKRGRLDSAKHHAEVERDRRSKLNGAIEQLRAFFPETAGPKHLVIERAVAHIEQLRFELQQLRSSSDSSSNSTGSRNQSTDDQNAVLESDRLDTMTPVNHASAFSDSGLVCV